MVRLILLFLSLALAGPASAAPAAPKRSDPHIDVDLESGCPVGVSIKERGNDPGARYCKQSPGGPLLSDAFCIEPNDSKTVYWIEADGAGRPSNQCFTVEMVVTVDGRPTLPVAYTGWMNENQKQGPWAAVVLPPDIDEQVFKYTLRSGCGTAGPQPIYDCSFDPRILISGDGDPGGLGDEK